ncbi:MAG: transcriptional regulator [Acidobacteriaceae bacterium]|nr:transcriptional regulator [Acidobacteriaceae bacterium]
MNGSLQTELWTSWAAVLRSYAAAHGLNAPQHAVVEVSAERITLRVGSRWLAFTPEAMETSEGIEKAFALNEDGSVSIGDDAPEEMDFAAEHFAREVMFEE